MADTASDCANIAGFMRVEARSSGPWSTKRKHGKRHREREKNRGGERERGREGTSIEQKTRGSLYYLLFLGKWFKSLTGAWHHLHLWHFISMLQGWLEHFKCKWNASARPFSSGRLISSVLLPPPSFELFGVFVAWTTTTIIPNACYTCKNWGRKWLNAVHHAKMNEGFLRNGNKCVHWLTPTN